MIKQIYLVRGTEDESYKTFCERIYWEVDTLVKEKDISFISYTITENAPPSISIIPFRKKKIAAITIKKNDNNLVESIVNIKGFEGAYSVTEALPVAYLICSLVFLNRF